MKGKRSDFKIELHCHLDGSLPIETISELVGKEEVRKFMPEFADCSNEDILKSVVAPKDCGSLNEYLRCFELPKRLLATPEAMRLAGYRLAKELKESGIKYAEIRFAPQLHSFFIPEEEKAFHERKIIEALLAGIKSAVRFSDTKINVILCMMRNLPEGETGLVANTRTVFFAKEFLGKGVVGIDLAGAEARDATLAFESLFMLARDFKIPFTIHAGEAGDDAWRLDSVEKAIFFGAKRIGHGVALEKSPELRKLVRDMGIVVECCPISNLQTKAVVGGIDNHPIKMFLEEGLKVTVNTDNMTASDTTIDKEFELLRTIGITDSDIRTMKLNAIEGAFVSKKEKNRMKSKIM